MGRAEDIFEKLKKEGESAIDEFIAARQSEELYLDFKRSANDGRKKILHDRDLNNLAKAISGFGNSEGGVIVWGLTLPPMSMELTWPGQKSPSKTLPGFRACSNLVFPVEPCHLIRTYRTVALSRVAAMALLPCLFPRAA